MKRGSGACDAPRLNARRSERLIADHIRNNVRTEGNIQDLVRLVDEEIDGMASERRQELEAVKGQLAEVRRWLDRLYRAIETTDLEASDIALHVSASTVNVRSRWRPQRMRRGRASQNAAWSWTMWTPSRPTLRT